MEGGTSSRSTGRAQRFRSTRGPGVATFGMRLSSGPAPKSTENQLPKAKAKATAGGDQLHAVARNEGLMCRASKVGLSLEEGYW